MKYSTTLAFAVSLISSTEAINLVQRTNGPASVLGLDTVRKQTIAPTLRDRVRRLGKRATLQETLDNEETLYFANVTMGTPGQSLRLDIDTGSSDLWTNSATSGICQARGQLCQVSGTYSANDSSTYSYVNSDFTISYADGSYAIGDYVTDSLKIGGQTVTKVQFGIGYNSTSAQGILGVGYKTNEAILSVTGTPYNNLPSLLVSQGKINTMAYSLWLNDLDANTGSILFGGVDTDKYKGDLSTLPIIKEDGEYREFVIGLSSVTANKETVFNTAIPVLLDSGSSLTYLPDNSANGIFTIFGATWNDQYGAAIVDCKLYSSSATVDFNFSGATISVPMNELVIANGGTTRNPICILGISRAGSSTSVLGDTFLRSAYVVYDLNNNEISLASTNFNATSSNIQEITSGSGGVPGATVIATAVSTLAVATGGARNGGLPDVTAIGSSAWATPTGIPIRKLAAAAAAGLAMAL